MNNRFIVLYSSIDIGNNILTMSLNIMLCLQVGFLLAVTILLIHEGTMSTGAVLPPQLPEPNAEQKFILSSYIKTVQLRLYSILQCLPFVGRQIRVQEFIQDNGVHLDELTPQVLFNITWKLINENPPIIGTLEPPTLEVVNDKLPPILEAIKLFAAGKLDLPYLLYGNVDVSPDFVKILLKLSYLENAMANLMFVFHRYTGDRSMNPKIAKVFLKLSFQNPKGNGRTVLQIVIENILIEILELNLYKTSEFIWFADHKIRIEDILQYINEKY